MPATECVKITARMNETPSSQLRSRRKNVCRMFEKRCAYLESDSVDRDRLLDRNNKKRPG
jgi:hypothetical protein